VVDRARF